MFRAIIIVLVVLAPMAAQAVEYHCNVEKKFNSEHTYTQSDIEKFQYSVRIEEIGNSALISRCSFSTSEQTVTCDRYVVDKIESDSYVKIKKYYNFRSQLDVQLWRSLFFVENNGRAGIAFGNCKVVAP